MRDFAAPTAKCAMSETIAATLTAGIPNGSGQGPRDGRNHRFTQPFLGRVETLPRECLNELLLIPCEVIDEAFRIFLRQASDLIAEGEHLTSFSFVVLDGFPLPCKLCLEYLSLAFCGKIRS